jgi:hypothetical protein
MHPASGPELRALRLKMETEWVPQMMQHLSIERDAMPIIGTPTFSTVRSLPTTMAAMCCAK